MKHAELDFLRAKLGNFLAPFRDLFYRDQSQECLGQYVSGLLLDGERKSMEPMAARVAGAKSQNFQQFIADSKWDSKEMVKRIRMDVSKQCGLNLRIAALDDTAFPKKGKLSVGVAHQYCGVLGKLANCQSGRCPKVS
jgi:SRSO17 transposase